MIDTYQIYSAVLVVAILLIVLSIPSIILTVRESSHLLKRYRLLKCVGQDDIGELHKTIRDEWSSVDTPLTYATMLSEEMERLNSLRPAVLQAEIGLVLIVFLAIVPRFENDVLVFMILVIAAVLLTLIYCRLNGREYAREYVEAMSELESNGDDHDVIYA